MTKSERDRDREFIVLPSSSSPPPPPHHIRFTLRTQSNRRPTFPVGEWCVTTLHAVCNPNVRSKRHFQMVICFFDTFYVDRTKRIHSTGVDSHTLRITWRKISIWITYGTTKTYRNVVGTVHMENQHIARAHCVCSSVYEYRLQLPINVLLDYWRKKRMGGLIAHCKMMIKTHHKKKSLMCHSIWSNRTMFIFLFFTQ